MTAMDRDSSGARGGRRIDSEHLLLRPDAPYV